MCALEAFGFGRLDVFRPVLFGQLNPPLFFMTSLMETRRLKFKDSEESTNLGIE